MVTQREIAIVVGQFGNPQKIVQPDSAIKIPAHKNSKGRAILNTLQKRKKCPVVNAMTKLIGG